MKNSRAHSKHHLILTLTLAGLAGLMCLLNSFGERPSKPTLAYDQQSTKLADHPNPVAHLSTPASFSTSSEPDPATKARMSQVYSQLPLSFEANRGQTDAQAKFISRGGGYSLFLTPTEAVLSLTQPAISAARKETLAAHQLKDGGAAKQMRAVLRMNLAGANPSPHMEGLDELRGKSHYFIGNDQKQWRTDVPHYAKVRYRDVYPGVDLIYYGNQQQLEYDLVVAPGVDPKVIKLAFAGMQRMSLDASGDLLLRTAGGEIRQHKPVIYQNVNGVRKEIAGRYVIRNQSEVGFEVADYDISQPLVIDPVLAYATFLGGSGNDFGYGIAPDNNGHAYITGTTGSVDFPALSPFPNYGGNDVFVVKIDTNKSGANALVYSTLLGGSGSDIGYGIAIDSAGHAYVTGGTTSKDFPTKNPYQTSPEIFNSAVFVSRLNAAGDGLDYSTYLGGDRTNIGYGIAVDNTGNAYVTGATISTLYPFKNEYQRYLVGGYDAFLTRIDTNKSGATSLVYSTFLGSSDDDFGYGIAIDSTGNAYVTGATRASDYPVKNQCQSYQPGGSGYDAFLTRIDTNKSGATSLVYSTFLGGNNGDFGYAIAVDATGNAYVTGQTLSSNFPTKNPYQVFPGHGGVFVTKIGTNKSGADSLIYSSFLGGNNNDAGRGIAIDSIGDIYLTGYVSSADFPTTFGASQWGGGYDAFITKLAAADMVPIYSSFLGGSRDDYGYGIAVDNTGSVYLTGNTTSSDFPSVNQYKDYRAGNDVFMTKLMGGLDLKITKSHVGTFRAGNNELYTLTVANVGLQPTSGITTVTDLLPSSLRFVSASGNGWACSTSGQLVTCTYGNPILVNTSTSILLSVNVASTAGPSVTNTANVSTPGDINSANNTASDSTMVMCLYTLAPTGQSFGVIGGSGNVTVMSPGSCDWTATSNASWILIAGGSTGNGNGTVSYSVTANPGIAPRTGTLTIAGQTFTVTQLGALYTISGRVTFTGSGLSGVTVTLSGSQSGTTQTDNNGNYSFANLSATGNYTVTTAKTNYYFTPQSQSFTNLSANQTANFMASTPIVSVSAASYQTANLPSESIATAFGINLSTVTQLATTYPLPTTLGGTRVDIKESGGALHQVPLFFVSPGQVNFYIPVGVGAGTATIFITNGDGLVSIGTVQIGGVAPSIFTANSDGQGAPAAVMLRLGAGNRQSFEPVAQFDAQQNKFVPRPLDLGPETDVVFLELFGTGLRYRDPLSVVRVTIGGVNAEVQYAGAQGDFAGLDQINVRVPRNLIGRGVVPLVLTVDGQTANTVLVNIK